MQISQPIHNGDLVEVRRQRWRVLDIRPYEACQLLTLTGIGTANLGDRRRFLAPFDPIVAIDRPRSVRLVRLRRWRNACRAVLAEHTPAGSLRSARQARIDLLPHQLEPALAVVRGRGTRVLLADDVGLGKTIQAGLIIAELQERGLAERVLIVAPAGLRDQWRAELLERFGIDATVVGLGHMRQRTATLPFGVNPWITVPTAIASIDYVKRPEILHSMRACRWDVVIVDEAHGAGPGSERHAAISTLAGRAPYVLLLTATPHHGDPRAFAALCAVGAHGDPLLVFRRTKADVRLGTGRHIHTLHVGPTIAERRLHALLEGFATAVHAEHDSPDAWLALSVLHKRAFSSARSLELTVARRLDALAPDRPDALQLALPWSDDGGEIDRADEPPDCLETIALADTGRERQFLRGLLDAAQAAGRLESKIRAIRRLLRRIAEPVLVFTEFRDTLNHLRSAIDEPVAILHGGLSRQERAASLDDFVSGRRRILLATDAGSEGLNLHHRCRVVVNLELPWNPMRLEQRIGRVDRIGQRRRVEVFHLVGRDTGESRVLERLKARLARAGADIECVNPIEDERLMARWVIGARAEEPPPVAQTVAPSGPAPDRLVVDMNDLARMEASRLTGARAISSSVDPQVLAALDTHGPWMAKTRRRETRVRLGRRIVAIVRVDHEDRGGRMREASLVALTSTWTHEALGSLRQVRAVLEAAAGQLESLAGTAVRNQNDAIAADAVQWLTARLARERRFAESVAFRVSPLQPGLFDRRAERAQATERAAIDEVVDDSRSRFDLRAPVEGLAERRGRLLLVLVVG